MSLFRRPEKMEIREIEALAGLKPLFDPVFAYLLESAIKGQLAVFYAAVPRTAIRPFDEDYAPRKHPVGDAAVRDVIARWRGGDFQPVWVYQKDQHFVLSDDYIVWEAAKEGQPDYLPCWILGRPDHPDVVDARGPLEHAAVLKAVGLES